MPRLAIRALQPAAPELRVVAGWRVAAFGGTLDRDVDEEAASLAAFAADPRSGAALIAMVGDEPAGTCLLVPREIDPLHDVSPWLAGLYVAPGHRRHGVGAALVRAIEDEARRRAHALLYLYTTDAEPFYAARGWQPHDRFAWKGHRTVLMVRELTG